MTTYKERVSIVIPTYMREDDLRACLATVAQQTVRPLEVIVIDDDTLSAVPGADLLAAAGIECVSRRKNGDRGSAASRQIGTALARGDFVLYLDDDVELEADHIENLLAVFRNDPTDRIAGAGGFNTRNSDASAGKKLAAWCSLALMIGGPRPGRVLPSGFSTTFAASGWNYRHPIDCDFLPGCDMMFRRELAVRTPWTLEYEGYGLGEDQDFAYRISRTHRLVLTPDARFIHKVSPAGKPDPRLRGRLKILHHSRFYKHRVRQSPWQDAVFIYAMLGYMATRILAAIIRPSRANRLRVRGMFDGLATILGRGDNKA